MQVVTRSSAQMFFFASDVVASVAVEWPVAELSASGLFLHRACTASAELKLSLWRSTELLNSA